MMALRAVNVIFTALSGGCDSEAEGRQEHTPFRPPASSGPAGDKPAGGRDSEAEGRQWPHPIPSASEFRGSGGYAPRWINEEVPGRRLSVRDFRRTAATYSPSWWASTIGADELNGSVRDGKRWILIALTTAIYYLRDHIRTVSLRVSSFLEERVRAISTGRLCHRWLYTSRLSTSWSTTTL